MSMKFLLGLGLGGIALLSNPRPSEKEKKIRKKINIEVKNISEELFGERIGLTDLTSDQFKKVNKVIKEQYSKKYPKYFKVYENWIWSLKDAYSSVFKRNQEQQDISDFTEKNGAIIYEIGKKAREGKVLTKKQLDVIQKGLNLLDPSMKVKGSREIDEYNTVLEITKGAKSGLSFFSYGDIWETVSIHLDQLGIKNKYLGKRGKSRFGIGGFELK